MEESVNKYLIPELSTILGDMKDYKILICYIILKFQAKR